MQSMLPGNTDDGGDTGANLRSFYYKEITILRRANIILESLIDFGSYTLYDNNTCMNGKTSDTNNNGAIASKVLRGYNLISFIPRNETIFNALCGTPANLVYGDLITLDYYSGNFASGSSFGNLQFKLCPSNLR
mmetsp:Transcript_113/g.127  ORF Transcript_113/g.127 Transcript_113/m.127 type:complete len:134 (+) Transcript_113:533-934(+)